MNSDSYPGPGHPDYPEPAELAAELDLVPVIDVTFGVWCGTCFLPAARTATVTAVIDSSGVGPAPAGTAPYVYCPTCTPKGEGS